MKNKETRRRLLALALSIVMTASCLWAGGAEPMQVSAGESTSLAEFNGTFEGAKLESPSFDWYVFDGGNDSLQYVNEGGEHGTVITVTKKSPDMRYATLSTGYISVEAGKTYQVSYDAKGTGTAPQSWLMIYYFDTTGKHTDTGTPEAEKTLGTEWTKGTAQFTVPDGITGIHLRFRCRGAQDDTLSFDNIALNPMVEEEQAYFGTSTDEWGYTGYKNPDIAGQCQVSLAEEGYLDAGSLHIVRKYPNTAPSDYVEISQLIKGTTTTGTYVFSAWIKGSTKNAGDPMHLIIPWTTGTWTDSGTDTLNVAVTASEWTQISYEFEVTKAQWVPIQLQCHGYNGADFYMDNVEFYKKDDAGKTNLLVNSSFCQTVSTADTTLNLIKNGDFEGATVFTAPGWTATGDVGYNAETRVISLAQDAALRSDVCQVTAGSSYQYSLQGVGGSLVFNFDKGASQTVTEADGRVTVPEEASSMTVIYKAENGAATITAIHLLRNDLTEFNGLFTEAKTESPSFDWYVFDGGSDSLQYVNEGGEHGTVITVTKNSPDMRYATLSTGYIPVEAGKTYQVSYEAKGTGTAPQSWLMIYYFDTTGKHTDTGTPETEKTLGTEWTKGTAQFTVPDGVVGIHLRFRCRGAQDDTLSFDNIALNPMEEEEQAYLGNEWKYSGFYENPNEPGICQIILEEQGYQDKGSVHFYQDYAQCAGTGKRARIGQEIRKWEAKTYLFSAWIKGNTKTAGDPAFLELPWELGVWNDNNDSTLKMTVNAADWTYVEYEFTVTTPKWAPIHVLCGGYCGADFYLDDISIYAKDDASKTNLLVNSSFCQTVNAADTTLNLVKNGDFEGNAVFTAPGWTATGDVSYDADTRVISLAQDAALRSDTCQVTAGDVYEYELQGTGGSLTFRFDKGASQTVSASTGQVTVPEGASAMTVIYKAGTSGASITSVAIARLESGEVEPGNVMTLYDDVVAGNWGRKWVSFPGNDTYPASDGKNTSKNYMEIVAEGCQDEGALHIYNERKPVCDMKAVLSHTVPAGTYTIKMYVKGTACEYMNQRFHFMDGENYQNGFAIAQKKLYNDWTELSGTFTLAADTDSFTIWVSMYNWTVELYIDNIRLINENGVDMLDGKGNFCLDSGERSQVPVREATILPVMQAGDENGLALAIPAGEMIGTVTGTAAGGFYLNGALTDEITALAKTDGTLSVAYAAKEGDVLALDGAFLDPYYAKNMGPVAFRFHNGVWENTLAAEDADSYIFESNLVNATFDTDVSGWTGMGSSTISCSENGYDGGALTVTRGTEEGDPDMEAIAGSSSLLVKPGATYHVRFMVKADGKVNLGCLLAAGEDFLGDLACNAVIGAGTDGWQQMNYTFTVPEDTAQSDRALGVVLAYDFSDTAAEIAFDSIAFYREYEPGDANGDGSIDVRDLVRYKAALAGYNGAAFASLNGADYTDNCYVNVIDLIRVRRYLVDPAEDGAAAVTEVPYVALNLPAVVYSYNNIAKDYLTSADADAAAYILDTDDSAKDTILRLECSAKDASYQVEYGINPDYTDAITVNTTETSIAVNNLYKNATYYVRVTATANGFSQVDEGSFRTTDIGPRVMTIGGLHNVRDLGGYVTEEGRTTVQGIAFRGIQVDSNGANCSLTTDGQAYMSETLQIKTDIDLRGSITALTKSFINSATLKPYAVGAYETVLGKDGAISDAQKQICHDIFAGYADVNNYPAYVHCVYGADRTGTICFLLNALVGVPEEILLQDYEYTTFSATGLRTREDAEMAAFLKNFRSLAGNTTAEKAETYMHLIGITDEEIANIRGIMLGDIKVPGMTYAGGAAYFAK